ncbi:MAG: nucleotide exchange factor GrpE [bacterium]
MSNDRNDPTPDAEARDDAAFDAALEADLPLDEIGQLEERLLAAQDEAKKNLDALLRARADLDNLRKRSAREVLDAGARARAEALAPLLQTLDDLDRALGDPASDVSTVRAGIVLVRDNLNRRLESYGVTAMETQGARFDPTVHEAVGGVPHPDVEPGMIVQEVQRGFLADGRVLRPARVIVSVARDPEPPAPGQE